MTVTKIITRYTGLCAHCREHIYVGDTVYWVPEDNNLFCETCAKDVLL